MEELKVIQRPSSNEGHGYNEFRRIIATNIGQIEKHTSLFKIQEVDLFEIFLSSLPEEDRQHYNCSSCRNFLNKYGRLVRFNEKWEVESLTFFDSEEVPPYFKKAMENMRKAVESKKIETVNVFSNFDTHTLGTPTNKATITNEEGVPETLQWTHFYGYIDKDIVLNREASAAESEYIEKFKMLKRVVNEFSEETVNTVYLLVKNGGLYRADKVMPQAQFLRDLYTSIKNLDKNRKDNAIWWEVQLNPSLCHIRSTSIGMLLDDIQSGMSLESAKRRFADALDPSKFGRSQTPPSAIEVTNAEKVVAELGVSDALQNRRFLKSDEIPEEAIIWKSPIKESKEEKKSGGIFSNVEVRDKIITPEESVIPEVLMTWDKFTRTVLPEATEIMVDISGTRSREVTLITSDDSTPLFQWDNNVSWSYSSGIDAEIKRRVEEAGGNYEDNELRVSLAWNNFTDLDLHCVVSSRRSAFSRHHIYYSNKSAGGGSLDIDRNAGTSELTEKPVENIFFKKLIDGEYEFYVHNFSDRSGGKGNPYNAEMVINGNVYTAYGDCSGQDLLFKFEIKDGKLIDRNMSINSRPVKAASNLKKLNKVVKSPNLWGEKQVGHVGSHTIFILEDFEMNDSSKLKSMYTEMLRPELREIRRVVDFFTNNSAIAGESSAHGLGFINDRPWNLKLVVTTSLGKQIIKIDRLD